MENDRVVPALRIIRIAVAVLLVLRCETLGLLMGDASRSVA